MSEQVDSSADTSSGAQSGVIVDVAWLQAHRDDPGLRIVDARPFGHYAMGHIPGATWLDVNAIRLPDSSPAGIGHFVETTRTELRRIGIQPGDRVVFYEEISGTLAARGVWMLDAVGHRGGAMLNGGLHAWIQAGESLTREPVTVAPSDLNVTLDRSVVATADEIVAALDAGDELAILDTRNDLEFMSGTIPTSTHIEWLQHLSPDGVLRPLDELRDLYADAGITAEDARPVVTFCGSGFRAAHTYVLLKALGFPTVRNYAPSWGEWGRRSDLPVERPGRRA